MRFTQPFASEGFSLPAELVLIAKLLALASLRQPLFPLFLPFVPFDAVATAVQFQMVLDAMWWTGYLLLFFTALVRTACLLLGSIWILGLLACQPCHSVAHTYVGCLFLVLAASSHQTGPWLVRAQLVVLYAAAAMHKALDIDWWNGRYFETLLVVRHQVQEYASIASMLPPLLLSKVFGAATVATQVALAVLLTVPRWHGAGVALGTLFHGSMVVMLNTTFGPFFVAILASYLAFVRLPERVPPAVLFAPVFPMMSSYGDGMLRNATMAALAAAGMWYFYRNGLRTVSDPNRCPSARSSLQSTEQPSS